MSRREDWRKVLDGEVKRWSGFSWERLIAELKDGQVYEVEVEGLRYQVEVELLEENDQFVHFAISVDDGSLPASLSPLTETLIIRKGN